MEYQIVDSEVAVDKGDLIIFGRQILHQPIRQLVHGWNVFVRCSSVLLRPGGHL